AEYSDNPELQSEMARIHARLAIITAQTVSPDEAIRHYQEAQQILDPLTSEAVVADSAKRDLATVLTSLEQLYFEAGRLSNAHSALQRAISFRQAIAARDPHDHEAQVDLAKCHYQKGMLYNAQSQIIAGTSPATHRLHEEAVQIGEDSFRKALG